MTEETGGRVPSRLRPIAREIALLGKVSAYPLKRRFGLIDRRGVREYLRRADVPKLHIGCGDHPMEGWLNSDYFPHSPVILHLDATRPFPFRDSVFDYVYCEHMIEHVPHPQGLNMLTECIRVLKPGGTARISTPDLAFLIRLYHGQKSELEQEYVKWATDNFIPNAPCYHETFVINNFVRDWGHAFIYDEGTLRASMEKAGFTGIVRRELNQSSDETLRNLENAERMPEGFLALETVTLEGSKPEAVSSPR